MRKTLLIIFLLSIFINTGQTILQILQQQKQKDKLQLHNLGDQFKELESVFNKFARAGYYTDKNMENPLAIAQYEQAQYHLAPTILDLNNTNYPLVIFDCTTPQIAITKINELGLQAIKASPYGVILAINPKASGAQP